MSLHMCPAALTNPACMTPAGPGTTTRAGTPARVNATPGSTTPGGMETALAKGTDEDAGLLWLLLLLLLLCCLVPMFAVAVRKGQGPKEEQEDEHQMQDVRSTFGVPDDGRRVSNLSVCSGRSESASDFNGVGVIMEGQASRVSVHEDTGEGGHTAPMATHVVPPATASAHRMNVITPHTAATVRATTTPRQYLPTTVHVAYRPLVALCSGHGTNCLRIMQTHPHEMRYDPPCRS